VLNTPLIIVLGHDACGAVDATIKSIRDQTTLPGHLPSLVSAISPAVEAVRDTPGDLLENAIRRNVMLNVKKLSGVPPILKSFVDDKKNPRGRRDLQDQIRTRRAGHLMRAFELASS
jgi:carbonic anhydrase